MTVAGCLAKVLQVFRLIKQLLGFSLVLADLTGTVKRNAAMFILMPRSGTRPRKAVRVLLNNRNTKSLDMVLADLTSTVKRNAAMCIFNAQECNAASESSARPAEQPEHQVPGHGPG
jgi:hypothetical protein